jgi:hypothetical protein
MSEGSKYQVRRVFDEAVSLFEAKNADYGDAWRHQGWRGNLGRIFEKTERLRTLLWRGDVHQLVTLDEDARQTAVDMLNTLAFFIINWDDRREWGHEDQGAQSSFAFNHTSGHIDPNPDYEGLPPISGTNSALYTFGAGATRQIIEDQNAAAVPAKPTPHARETATEE